jgi:hypothetical protein
MLNNCHFVNRFHRSFSKLGMRLIAIAFLSLFPTDLMKATEEDAQLAKSSEDFPVVESTNLDTDLDVPWSQPVRIQDSFEGESLGIFDRHYFYSRVLNNQARIEVISLWSPNSIRFLLAYSDRNCGFEPNFYAHDIESDCLTSNAALKITDVYLKIGEEVFRLEGKNSRFRVNNKLANALKNSPSENINIRLIVENGETVDSEIGQKTVEAWKIIY